MRVRSLQESDDRRVRGAVMAYLEGSKNLDWVAGVIQSYGNLLGAGQLLAKLRGHGLQQRYDKLAQWFDSESAVRQ